MNKGIAPEVLEQIANVLGEIPYGLTLHQAFRQCEQAGATVYWGLWSDAELAIRITRS